MNIYPSIHETTPLRVTLIGLLVNLGLAFFKATAGVLSNSAAMIADAGHSFSDVLSDIVTLWAIRMARIPKDDNHPYGHGKFETLGSLFVAVMLIITGGGIALHAFGKVEQQIVPGTLALIAAFFSILLKELLYHITVSVAKRNNSRILRANAWHHRSDAISSILAFIGIGGAQMGYPMLDPIAGILVAVWIIKIGITIGYDSLKELTDVAVEQDIFPALDAIVKEIDGVIHYHNARARQMGPYLLIDLHIQVDSKLSVSAAHQIAERVRLSVLNETPHVNEVLVHVDAEEDNEEALQTLMRPQNEIENDIRKKLSSVSEIESISHVLCHFLQERLTVQIEIVVDPGKRVYEVQEIAKKARKLIEQIDDIYAADIHLELDDD